MLFCSGVNLQHWMRVEMRSHSTFILRNRERVFRFTGIFRKTRKRFAFGDLRRMDRAIGFGRGLLVLMERKGISQQKCTGQVDTNNILRG